MNAERSNFMCAWVWTPKMGMSGRKLTQFILSVLWKLQWGGQKKECVNCHSSVASEVLNKFPQVSQIKGTSPCLPLTKLYWSDCLHPDRKRDQKGHFLPFFWTATFAILWLICGSFRPSFRKCPSSTRWSRPPCNRKRSSGWPAKCIVRIGKPRWKCGKINPRLKRERGEK